MVLIMIYHRDGKIILRDSDGELELTKETLDTISGFKKGQTNVLKHYPNITHSVQVRELFVRIFELLDFQILRSSDSIPNYILRQHEKTFGAHVVVTSSEIKHLDLPNCEMIICWRDTLSKNDRPDGIEILSLEEHFDLLGN